MTTKFWLAAIECFWRGTMVEWLVRRGVWREDVARHVDVVGLRD